MSTLYLVACSATKGTQPAPARDLYQGGAFKLARSWVESIGAPWLILSAKHELLSPSTTIAPYEQPLLKEPWPWRRGWAARVMGRLCLETAYVQAQRVVLLAGSTYCEYLVDLLQESGREVLTPLARKGIGEQLGYLSARVREVRP